MKDATPISLEKAHAILGWPEPTNVTHPSGAGAAIFADLAREKIGRALVHFTDGQQAYVGVLSPDVYSSTTEPPIAIVVEFASVASERTLRELHRLSWNFSHSPILITLEPNLLRVWSCCEAPDPGKSISEFLVHQLLPEDLQEDGEALENNAARALHWINLVSGEFFSQYPDRFDRDGRADQMLLGNLRYIRGELAKSGLVDDDVCHDLLARIIFVQFLFDRKDSDGAAALTPAKLGRLHTDGVLAKSHASFDSVLSDYDDTYSLFDWLNVRFNGDLFPGKGDTAQQRAQGWAKEKNVVSNEHLAILAEFIRGDVDMPSGQGCLWPQYSFDVIPLEFISSIYETFVTERAAADGIFYTPPHLVDFVLDRVLPWGGKEWDLKVIDPACGSGIFLVKAFQRLVHRWKLSNPNQIVRAEVLRRILDRNLFGVDKDPHAVRVACFSLYLAMCDEIEPRHYWTQVVFPSMRGKRLICSDFFEETLPGFSSEHDLGSYDLVVGNAPWGENLVTESAVDWAKNARPAWTVANRDIGGLFLAKAAMLLREGSGVVAMIQSASALLFNGSRAAGFRKELFLRHRVEAIYNLSALRFKVFKRKSHTTKTSVSPSCVVIMRARQPEPDERISYVSPKHLKPLVDEFTIVIEPQDCRWVTVREAISDDLVWISLMWGGSRDRVLLKKLQRQASLRSESLTRDVKVRQGVIYGDRSRPEPGLNGLPLFEGRSFPEESLLTIDVDSLPKISDISVHSKDSSDFSAFSWPQLIIKKGWQKAVARFQARLASSAMKNAAIFNDSYVSIHADSDVLERALIALNSMVAVYFLQLTSGRIAAYRPAALVNELLRVPLPPSSSALGDVSSFEEIDNIAFKAYRLKDAERVLVEDMFNYTLADFRGDERSAGRQATSGKHGEQMLREYCQYFSRVIRAGFGDDKAVKATIFRCEDSRPLPYRLVAFQLGVESDSAINVVDIGTVALLKELERIDLSHSEGNTKRRGIYHERVVKVYDSSSGAPTVLILKPDIARYWTRSAGLNDADEVALDLFRWGQSAVNMEVSK
ncbi:HsdM family class I SAM-dependent methyltransferase [Pseudomonas aeruginosa]|uniref:HsdM family class I SAM-dependent methyltransferase n=1 Tax=Pseudomonas aeruginosa TaxID=287 RepID=UPI0003B940F9|nr:N-6 DNA methylase [Pseudomonas aeruginosa]EIU1437247.1 N-6 DNA methylase [Pseudomonas aeruginosa]EIU2893034.1 N-6 DNA methylase [Pseudomonas aeruginosa]EIU2918446.1 N-6 DNA methylase [Pseudomonas aeruginosa]EJN6719153.1 N-6 DNA methylase [Pseudomonas aeruginosa]EKU2412678.1 N-6 DNA methylase [Pseudomonas aeruginosa]